MWETICSVTFRDIVWLSATQSLLQQNQN
jgi:hypothetical protein